MPRHLLFPCAFDDLGQRVHLLLQPAVRVRARVRVRVRARARARVSRN